MLNDYYDVKLKHSRLQELKKYSHFSFIQADICDHARLQEICQEHQFSKIVHLAAQAGVRYSMEHPFSYVESNLRGFVSIAECVRRLPGCHLIYASTSSVYGLNSSVPFRTEDPAQHPISLYAATKRANELLAHSYSHLYGIPSTGLRFFTVYGPFGRPDMALFLFTRKILAGEEIEIYNFGKNKRDFTYVSDIVEAIDRVVAGPNPKGNPAFDANHPVAAQSSAPFVVFNIGCGQVVGVEDFVATLEKSLGLKAKKKMVPAHPGDVEATWADLSTFTSIYGDWKRVELDQGVESFVRWYRGYYHC